eukprot:TRINITY_DN1078_c0_g1_i1.p1 TRINITY_DN1078_c0_g1~~TRINITY_DN1078_c0_g1_i1.p1  ORF type:complete len:509 (+),score=110.20 TRINITY_DN1078_c0_g1_i1:49-1527(+)
MACWRGLCKVCRPKKDTCTVTLREQLVLCTNNGRIRDYYSMEREQLGAGSFGSVRKAISSSTGLSHAVKTVMKNKAEDPSLLKREIEITKAMDHPNIVKLVESFEDERVVYLVMELCTGGELFDRIVDRGHVTEKQGAMLVQQMARAISYMHGVGICHRDLKPENWLLASKDPLDSCELKLVDFGLACKFDKDVPMSTVSGTASYVAPEVLSRSYGASCDLWSLGVIVYVLLSGRPAFPGKNNREILNRVKACKYDFNSSTWEAVTDGAKELIRKILVLDPQERYTADQVLEHPWVCELAPDASSWYMPSQMFGGGLSIIDNLKVFQLQSQFKKVALTVIAGQLNEEQIKATRDAFIALDTDNDGTLSRQEISTGLTKMNVDLPADLQNIMEAMDSNHSGQINYSEFLAAALDARTYSREIACWHAFKFFDRNNDGTITLDELKLLLENGELRDCPGAAKAASMLQQVDTDANGMVEFDEFMKMMASAEAKE